MEQLPGHVLTIFMGFFAIMNPIANTPIFLGLTARDSLVARKRVARNALMTAFLLIAAFVLAGKLIFSLFGISLPAFKIMGGILVAMIGYQMLHGKQSAVHQPGKDHAEDQAEADEEALGVAITPLAIPILAGPGTIATATSYAAGGGLEGPLITLGAFAALCLLTYLFFIYGERLVRVLGPSGLGVVTRIMGLILAVVGAQMLVDGVYGAVVAYS